MSDAAIQIEGVTKTFGAKVAVRDLNLSVPMGSVCGFLGPNGAGKTTTIRMVMAILFPDKGTIEVLGKRSAMESRADIGYLPEERGVYRKMKVGEFLTYIGRLKGVDPAPLSQRIDQWLERVALPDVRKKKCEELSKGMQQKVQFLAAILHDPQLIILDEPFSGLDPVNARLLREMIDEQHQSGKTIIFSTHVLASADAVCDRVFMINKGQKVLDGPIEGIRSRFDPRTIVAEPTGDLDQARGHIETMPSVQHVSHFGGPRPYFEIHLDDDADAQNVLREIASVVPLRRIETRRATLEDIFVSIVDPGDSEDNVRASISGEAETAVEASGHA